MACHFHPSTRARLSFLLPIPVFFRWPHTAPTPNVSHGQPLEGFINHSRIAARIHPGVHGLSLSPLWVPVAACHLCVPLPACNLYVPLPPCHLSVPLPACHSSVLLPACHLCVSVPALREGASRRRRSAGVCPGRAPGGPRRSRVPWGSSSGPGRAPGRCVPAVRSCCAGPAGPCTRSAASSPTACSTTTTAQPCPAERSAAGREGLGGSRPWAYPKHKAGTHRDDGSWPGSRSEQPQPPQPLLVQSVRSRFTHLTSINPASRAVSETVLSC